MLPGANGLKDPVEKETINILDCLELQEAEDVTASSQHALRLMAYRRIYKVTLTSLIGLDKTFMFQVLGVKEQQEMQAMLEPESGLDMIEGEPERKRLALMGASTGSLGLAAPPGMPV